MNLTDTDKINSLPINFIMGKERSGTTLLQVILNSHSNIIAPPESRFIMFLNHKYGKKTKWTEKNVDGFCEDLFNEVMFKDYWGVDKNELKNSILNVRDKLDYSLLCKLVFCQFATSKEPKLLVDKNPIYYYYLPYLNKLFPQAKYIHIVRDYRDNTISHKKISSSVLNTADMVYRWLRVNQLLENAKRNAPDKWLTITYESLVSDTEGAVRRVCEFLGVPFDERMITGHTDRLFEGFYRNKNNGDFRKFHESLTKPINDSKIGEWKEKMPAGELALVEAIAGAYGEKMYGYKMAHPDLRKSIGTKGMLLLKLKYGIIAIYFGRCLRYRFIYDAHKRVAKLWFGRDK